MPSSCGLRTGSGWNFGGTGGCSDGVDTVTLGGSPANGMGCSCFVGAGRGRLAGGFGAATGLAFGVAGWTATTGTCAAAAAVGAAGDGGATSGVDMLVARSLFDTGWPA